MPTSPIWEDFMVNADYVWITGDAFTDMRLLIEGAIVLYEEDLLQFHHNISVHQSSFLSVSRFLRCASLNLVTIV